MKMNPKIPSIDITKAIDKVLKKCFEDDGEWQDKKHLFSELEKELNIKR